MEEPDDYRTRCRTFQRSGRSAEKGYDLTNDLLKKNAEKLKTATIETAKESERGIIDMETRGNK